MPFFVGDDYGNVKRLIFNNAGGSLKLNAEDDLVEGAKGKQRAIQTMSFDANGQLASIFEDILMYYDADPLKKASFISC